MCNFFEKYSFTQPNAKENIATIRIKDSPKIILKKIKDYLEANDFIKIYAKDTYTEVFAIKDWLEYTFAITSDGLYSDVNIYVFSQNIGKSRQALIKMRQAILKLLDN
ncbi:MAG: hypothetical protein ACOX3K_04010 [Bacilli bacterium]|jgi:hypothetical protein